MAAPNILVNGIGGATGDTLATVRPLYHTGDVWYVSSANGVDAATPRGKERTRPLATLSQAYTNAAAGDTIVLLSGHAESLGVGQTLAKARLRIIGEGQGNNRPQFTCTSSIDMFNVSAAGVQIRNLYFPTSSGSGSRRILLAAAGCVVDNCYLNCGALDTAASLYLSSGADHCRITDTTFISTAVALTAQPYGGINVSNAISYLTMDNVVFDGNNYGWSNYAFDGTGTVAGLNATNISLINDSDMYLVGSNGVLHVSSASSAARVTWTS